MANENDFLAFATGSGANALTVTQYDALATLISNGFQSGVAPSAQVNTVLRQATSITAMIAAFSSTYGGPMVDDGNIGALATSFEDAFRNYLAGIFAALNGNASNNFAVADATQGEHAVPLAQIQTDFAALNGNAGQPFEVATAQNAYDAVPLAQAQGDFAPLGGNQAQSFAVAGPSNPNAQPTNALSSVNFPSYMQATGYKKYPDKNSPTGYFIEQWGSSNTTNGEVMVTFPTPFTGAVFAVVATVGAANAQGSFGTIQVGNVTLTEAEFWSAAFSTSPNGPANSHYFFYWMAKGY